MASKQVAAHMEIPARIRALAKVIHDNDLTLFPSVWKCEERAPSPRSLRTLSFNGPRAAAAAERLRRKTLALNTLNESELSKYDPNGLDDFIALLQNGSTLSREERTLFDAAFLEYDQHLRVVDMDTLQDARVSAVLKRTLAIDAESTVAGISLGQVLPAVAHAHNTSLRYVRYEAAPTLVRYMETLIRVVVTVLEDVLVEVVRNSENRVGAHVGKPTPESLQQLAELNSRLSLHMLHVDWLIECLVDDRTRGHFDAHDHIADLSARDVWCAFVGRNAPLCSTQQFARSLTLFPEQAQRWMLGVLDIYQCGVVSVFSLQRLLSLWGPYLLIDRNMLTDISSGMFSLDATTEECERVLRTTGQPGDYVASLSKKHGCVNISVVTTSRRVQTIVADRSSGAWILNGVSAEDFATVADAVRQFPQLFANPRGTTTASSNAVETPAHATGSATAVGEGDCYSNFHRACFHNNVQYVKTLLQRGAAVLVNTAVADPQITSAFSWTPLLCAANNPNGDPDQITAALIENGADARFQDEATCTPLYYAIANGFAKTVRILLQQNSQLESSAATRPLLVALGAHHFHESDVDNLRLADVVPSAAVVGEVLRFVHSQTLVRLAIAIVEGKMSLTPFRDAAALGDASEWKVASAHVPIKTADEVLRNDQAIEEHGRLCNEHRLEMIHILRALRMHSFKLSCHEHFGLKQ